MGSETLAYRNLEGTVEVSSRDLVGLFEERAKLLHFVMEVRTITEALNGVAEFGVTNAMLKKRLRELGLEGQWKVDV